MPPNTAPSAPFAPLDYTGPWPVKAEVTFTYEGSPPKPPAWEPHDFGVKDSKGRAIGASLLRRRCDVLPLKAEEYSVYASYYHIDKDTNDRGELRLGTGLFRVDMRATRAGAHFGAGFTHHHFTSEEEQEAWIVKYLKEARKRAEKTAAKGGR